MRAASVNQTLDVALRAGTYARRPPLPHVPGSDAAGEVAAVATDVKTLKVGDRVVCHPIVGRQASGTPKLLGVDTWGTYAEFVKVPASTVQIIPRPDSSACSSRTPWSACIYAIVDRAQVKPGEWVLVMAAGGLGSALVRQRSIRARDRGGGSDARVAQPSNWERMRGSITGSGPDG